jgi:hypothetical protein
MDRDAVSAYARRSWDEVERQKRAYWAEEYARVGAEATIRASRALFEHMRQVRSDWPTERDRQEDFEHHVRLKRLLDRTANALTVR